MSNFTMEKLQISPDALAKVFSKKASILIVRYEKEHFEAFASKVEEKYKVGEETLPTFPKAPIVRELAIKRLMKEVGDVLKDKFEGKVHTDDILSFLPKKLPVPITPQRRYNVQRCQRLIISPLMLDVRRLANSYVDANIPIWSEHLEKCQLSTKFNAYREYYNRTDNFDIESEEHLGQQFQRYRKLLQSLGVNRSHFFEYFCNTARQLCESVFSSYKIKFEYSSSEKRVKIVWKQ